MENAGENVKVRAREAVGYPETPQDWGAAGERRDDLEMDDENGGSPS